MPGTNAIPLSVCMCMELIPKRMVVERELNKSV